MASRILSPNSTLLPNTALAFALIPGLIGTIGLYRPRILNTALEFPLPNTPQDGKVVDELFRMISVRDLYLGGTTLAAWYYGDRKVLGCAMILGAVVTAADGVVQKAVLGHGEWRHWSFTPVLAGIGAGLLGLLDGLAG